jgi:hypothetical protein
MEFLNVHTALPPSIYFSSQTYHVRSPEHFKANGIASYTIFYENGLTGSARLPNFHNITALVILFARPSPLYASLAGKHKTAMDYLPPTRAGGTSAMLLPAPHPTKMASFYYII